MTLSCISGTNICSVDVSLQYRRTMVPLNAVFFVALLCLQGQRASGQSTPSPLTPPPPASNSFSSSASTTGGNTRLQANIASTPSGISITVYTFYGWEPPEARKPLPHPAPGTYTTFYQFFNIPASTPAPPPPPPPPPTPTPPPPPTPLPPPPTQAPAPTPSPTPTPPSPQRPVAAPGQTFHGELTYYGGAGEGGACTMQYVPEGFTTVAINNEQYGQGEYCGTCLHACFVNKELGNQERCFDAIVDNKCPECKHGDIDLGEDGSGRWPVDWSEIPCPKHELKVRTQGSHGFYAKVKVEGGPGGITKLTCKSKNGEMTGKMTDDAYFEFNDGDGRFGCGMDCMATFNSGEEMPAKVPGSMLGGECKR